MTIYEAMKAKLNREPTNAELRNECKRIIRDAHDDIAARRPQRVLHAVVTRAIANGSPIFTEVKD